MATQDALFAFSKLYSNHGYSRCLSHFFQTYWKFKLHLKTPLLVWIRFTLNQVTKLEEIYGHGKCLPWAKLEFPYSLYITGMYSPKESQRTKYSSNVKGGFNQVSFKSYNLPPAIDAALVNASNQSLAKSTWSAYNTAENHLKRCEVDTNVRMSFPMTDRELVCIYSILSN